MFKNTSFNQTQFSSEEPLMHGQVSLPPEELDPQQIADLEMHRLQQRRKWLTLLGVIFVLLGFIVWLGLNWQPSTPMPSPTEEEEVISPTPREMSLRDEIDQLIRQVNNNQRIGQSLAFPPVTTELIIESR